jgi:hypothetical protein
VDACYFSIIKTYGLRRVPLRKPLETVIDTDHLQALLHRLKGDRADHAVDPRGRAPADNNRKLFPHDSLLTVTNCRSYFNAMQIPRTVAKQAKIVNTKGHSDINGTAMIHVPYRSKFG